MYKRQVLVQHQRVFMRREKEVAMVAGHLQEKNGYFYAVLSYKDAPVSYTHLDVYKRQVRMGKQSQTLQK